MAVESVKSKYTDEQLRKRWRTPDGRKRLANVLRALRRREYEWRKYLIGFVAVDEIEYGKDLRFVGPTSLMRAYIGDFGWRLKGALLDSADLSGSVLARANLSSVELYNANLAGTNLSFANLSGAHLGDTNLSNVNVFDADLSDSDLGHANLSGAILTSTIMLNTRLIRANLSGTELNGAKFTDVVLDHTELTGANFSEAKFLYKKESIKKMLNGIKFASTHDSLNDDSDTIICSNRDKYMHWGFVRKLGSMPLFGVSWTALALSVIVVNSIGLLNDTELIKTWIKYPIPIPERMTWILIDSILLVFGTSLYKFGCPETVQEFTEFQWVQEHNNPRLIYLREKWSRHIIQWPTLVFLTTGGALALYLLGDRVVMAIAYLWRFFQNS